MSSIHISNVTIVNENKQFIADVFIKDERIEKIGSHLSVSADTVIDGTGKYLIPGMIDDQVHFREPGLTHKAEIRTESRAAVVGGVTSVMDMPNTTPQAVTCDVLEDKYKLAAEKSFANYSFYLGATNDNVDEIRKLDKNNVCGIKVFMGSSTGNMLVDNPETLEQIFKDAPTIILTHCEDTPMIEENEKRFHETYGDGIHPKYHPEIRSAEACYKSSSLAVSLAKKHGAKLHVLHLTTEKEMSHFESKPLSEKTYTAEVCVHHLFFNAEDYNTLGNQIKCNPAVKYETDRQALLKALREDKLDVIGTDHAPHTWEEKQREYWGAPSGIPLVQHALYALFELYKDGELDLELIVRKTSHAVADLYQIKDRGYIREGYYADLALVDLNGTHTVTKENIQFKCGWSPFEGKTFRSNIEMTFVNGQIVYNHGEVNESVRGKRLQFDR